MESVSTKQFVEKPKLEAFQLPPRLPTIHDMMRARAFSGQTPTFATLPRPPSSTNISGLSPSNMQPQPSRPVVISQPASEHLSQPSLKELKSRNRASSSGSVTPSTTPRNTTVPPSSPAPPPSLSASVPPITTQHIPAQLIQPHSKPPPPSISINYTSHHNPFNTPGSPVNTFSQVHRTLSSSMGEMQSAFRHSRPSSAESNIVNNGSSNSPTQRRSLPDKDRNTNDLNRDGLIKTPSLNNMNNNNVQNNYDYHQNNRSNNNNINAFNNSNHDDRSTENSLKLHRIFNDDKAFDDFTRSLVNATVGSVSIPTITKDELLENELEEYNALLSDGDQNNSINDTSKQLCQEEAIFDKISDLADLKLRSMRTALSKYSDQLKEAAKNKDPQQFVSLLGKLEGDYTNAVINNSPNTSMDQQPVQLLNADSLRHSDPGILSERERIVNNLENNSEILFRSAPVSPRNEEQNVSQPQEQDKLRDLINTTRKSVFPHSIPSNNNSIKTDNLTDIDNPIKLAHDLQNLAQAMKDRLKEQGTPKIREFELVHNIRTQYNRDLNFLKERENRIIEELTAQHQQEVSQLELNYNKRLEEMKQGFEKYIKQLEDRLLQNEKKFFEFEAQKYEKDMNEMKLKYEEELNRERVKVERMDRLLKQKIVQEEENELLRSRIEAETATNAFLKQQLFDKETKAMDANYIEELHRQIEVMKLQHSQDLHHKEQLFNKKMEELENLNIALRSSIQQMQDYRNVIKTPEKSNNST